MLKSAIVMTSAVTCAVLAGYGVLSFDQLTRTTSGRPDSASMATMTSPVDTQTSTSNTTAIPKSQDGHYWANAVINDKAVRFLVDTGATVVVLTQADAQRLGVSNNDLVYDHKVITAMGPTVAAKVTLASIDIGQSTVRNVDALIIKEGSSTSLLGMSYLGRLSSFEATPSSLILHP